MKMFNKQKKINILIIICSFQYEEFKEVYMRRKKFRGFNRLRI
jgi:hypothetical protein